MKFSNQLKFTKLQKEGEFMQSHLLPPEPVFLLGAVGQQLVSAGRVVTLGYGTHKEKSQDLQQRCTSVTELPTESGNQ